jgi:hypothetical protein
LLKTVRFFFFLEQSKLNLWFKIFNFAKINNMALVIKINGIEESQEFRKWLHKINSFGIDKVCDIIDQSIKDENLSDSYIISDSTLYEKKDKSKKKTN